MADESTSESRPAAAGCVVIPAFNEEATLADVLRRAAGASRRLLVVNDGSTDGTRALLERLRGELSLLETIEHPRNLGMAAALKTGLAHAAASLEDGRLGAGEAVVLMDADGQHRPEEIPSLVAALLARRLDLLIGRRDFRVYPAYKRMGNRLLSLWGKGLTGVPFQDIECGFKALRAGAIPRILPFYQGYRYSCAQEIAVISARLGLQVANDHPVSVPRYRRGARMRDFLPNLFFSLRAWRRVR